MPKLPNSYCGISWSIGKLEKYRYYIWRPRRDFGTVSDAERLNFDGFSSFGTVEKIPDFEGPVWVGLQLCDFRCGSCPSYF